MKVSQYDFWLSAEGTAAIVWNMERTRGSTALASCLFALVLVVADVPPGSGKNQKNLKYIESRSTARVKYRKWDRPEMGHLVLCEYLLYQLQTKTTL